MKFKQVVICFCALIVLFISSATTVYAAYEVPFKDIATAQKINWNDDYYFILQDDEYYYICPNNTSNPYNDPVIENSFRITISGSQTVITRPNSGTDPGNKNVYKVSKSNPYADWTVAYNGNSFGNLTINKAVSCYASSTDLYNSSNELVFSRAPLGQTTQGGTSTAPSSGSHLNLSTSMLSNVLSELIAVLPILFPVLISFIAIRKGLAFILQTLKRA